MSSVAADISDALKVDIDAQSWPVTLTAYREYMVSVNRSTLGSDKRVSIFPYTHQAERGVGRGNTTRTHGVALVVRAAADPSDTSELDGLVETLEQLSDRYTLQPIGTGTPQSVLMLLGDQLYDIDQLADARLFVGGIIINYTTRT